MIPLRDSIRPRRTPFINWTLIALNVYFFLLQTGLSSMELQQLFLKFGLVPARIASISPSILFAGHWEPFLPLISSMFLHGGLLHLGGNMLYLWVFGDNIEDRLGHLGYLLFYLAMGLVAGIAHVWANPFSTIPMIGASGAVAGVLGAYFIAFPKARVMALIPIFFFFTITEIRAVYFLFIWFMFQGLAGFGTIQGAQSVAWWAHIGGFLAGTLFFLILRPRARSYPMS